MRRGYGRPMLLGAPWPRYRIFPLDLDNLQPMLWSLEVAMQDVKLPQHRREQALEQHWSHLPSKISEYAAAILRSEALGKGR
jgi:hypothetical protein